MSIPLGDVLDEATAAGWLRRGGLGDDASAEKARRLGHCARALIDAGASDRAPAAAFFVPGRIEVLGKHTDYAGGRTIVAAAERGFCILAVARDDAELHVAALDLAETSAFEIAPDLTPTVGHWSNYPMTVARRVARNFPGPLRGANMALASDLPVAAGMSSSSALIVSVFHALAAVNALSGRPEYAREIADAESLAGYLATIENGQSFGTLTGDRGVGTFGGSEDHVAMLCSRPGLLSQYAYCPVRLQQRLALPAGWVLAIAASGVQAAKTGDAMAKYNRASALARSAVDAWNAAAGRDDPNLAAALADNDAADRFRDVLDDLPAGGAFPPDALRARFEHFLAEDQEIIPPAAEALTDGNVPAFGELVDRSQALAETLLGNQIPETIFLARSARESGAAAASAFGAGFGGSVWALVRTDDADAFGARWSADYAKAFPAPASRASFFLTRPGPAAFELAPAD